jgi:hypothetical protein
VGVQDFWIQVDLASLTKLGKVDRDVRVGEAGNVLSLRSGHWQVLVLALTVRVNITEGTCHACKAELKKPLRTNNSPRWLVADLA